MIGQKFEIMQEQKQQLSQAQIQSLEILSLDATELSQFLQNEYLENPMLDYTGDKGNPAEDISTVFERPVTYEQNYEEFWEKDRKQNKEIPMPDGDAVKKYLMEQLPEMQWNSERRKLTEYLIDCLDDNGYFTFQTEEVAEKFGLNVNMVEKQLDLLRDLEPYGIFAVDLKHCLLKQLEKKGLQDSPVWKIVDNYLPEVADGKISYISRKLGLKNSEVRQCIEQIVWLDPRPMKNIASGTSDYVIPDLIFKKENDCWEAELNDNWIENYQVNDFYVRMMQETNDEQMIEYFRKKLERVRFIIRSIEQRRRTLQLIAEAIEHHQQEYLSGQAELKPMTMADVAMECEVHVSTVSRAVKGKYVQYPGGTVPMKSFFQASAIRNLEKTEETEITAATIKKQIQKYIREEDESKPYSDQKLVQLLENDGIKISRRAVAKYREELGIKGSFDRKH